MATVIDYLKSKKEQDPSLAYMGYSGIYNKLKQEGDPNLPEWDLKPSGQTYRNPYQTKIEPGFVNSLFDWTDWGIDEGSSKWAKSAYNNSITGLAYNYYNGHERFDLDGYDPGIAEDIFSAVLSFMMPLDLLAMRVGGKVIGRGMQSLAGYSTKSRAISKLATMMPHEIGAIMGQKVAGKIISGLPGTQQTKLWGAAFGQAAKKETVTQVAKREALAKTVINKWFSPSNSAAIFATYSPRGAAVLGQSGTLATFEGARGAIQAAVNGEDVWKGIGNGVMHGGVMGGIAGFTGASLNSIHAKLFAKSKIKGEVLSPWESRLMKSTGTVGQVVAEGTAFTLSPFEIKNLITEDDYTAKDLIRNLIVNIGMMGVLKAQHKGQDLLWNKGKESLQEWKDGDGKIDVKNLETLIESVKEVKENAGIETPGVETSAQTKMNKVIRRTGNEFETNELAKLKLKKEEIDGYESQMERVSKTIEELQTGKKTLNEINPDALIEVYQTIQAIHGSMLKNISKYKKGGAEGKEAREQKLEYYKELEAEWKEKIMDPLQNLEKVRQKNEKVSERDREDRQIELEADLSQVWPKANKMEKEFLRKGNEEAIDAEGRITDISQYETIRQKIDSLLQASNKFKQKAVTIVKGKGEFKEKLTELKQEEPEAFTITAAEEINKIRKGEGVNKNRTPIEKDLAEETLRHEQQIDKSGLSDKIYSKNAKGETFHVENSTRAQETAYAESKELLKYISRELTRKSTPIEGAKEHLQIADKMARFLASQKNPKSLFEISKKDIESFVEQNPKSYQTGVSNVVKTLSSLAVNYPGILKGKIGITTGEQVAELYRTAQKASKTAGIMTTTAELSPTEINVKGNTLKTGTKTDVKLKPITTRLGKLLESLDKKAQKNTNTGDNDYIFTDTKGKALVNADANAIIEALAGLRKQTAGGSARAPRYALLQWAKAKYGKESSEYYMIDKFSLGHTSEQKMDARYSDKVEATGLSKEKYVSKILEKYIKDIEAGEFTDINGNVVKASTLNKNIRQTGYYPHELKTGLDIINKMKDGDTFSYKAKGQTKKVDKATLETLYRYAIETGPRIKEIVPTEKALNASRKYANEVIEKTNRQIETQLKAGERIAKIEELVQLTKWVKKKYPQLSVNLENTLGTYRGKQVLGQIQGHLIKIAKGKAKIDTLPHEVSHHVVDVLKSMGDPFSKRLVETGIKMFRKKGMSKAQAEEAFVEALGKYSAKNLTNKSMVGRVKSWVKRAFSHMRQYFGITNKNDVQLMQKEIVRIIGGKVISGKIPTSYLPLKSKLKINRQTVSDKAGKKIVEDTYKRIKEVESELTKELNYTKEELMDVAEVVTGKRELKVTKKDSPTVFELEAYEATLNSIANHIISGKNKKAATNLADIEKLETQYNISERQRNEFFQGLKTTPEKANKKAIKMYKTYIIKGNEIVPASNTAINDNIALKGYDAPTGVSWIKRGFMRASDVLREYGGEPGRRLAEHIDNFDITRSVYKGEGLAVVDKAERLVDRRTRKHYMHLLDHGLAKGAIKDLTNLLKRTDLTQKERNKFEKELFEAAEAIVSFSKNGKYHEVREDWNELSNFYWKMMGQEVLKTTKGVKEFEKIMDGLNEKYIRQYFARRVTSDALKHIKTESPEIQRLIKEQIKSLTEADLKRIADAAGIKKSKDPQEYRDIMNRKSKELDRVIGEELMAMFEYGPAKVKPAFLKERGVQLPEYIEIVKDGKRKFIKSYETHLDGTIGAYSGGMAKFLATIRHFPEFTALKGEFTLKGDAKLKNWELLSKDKSMGAYAYETIRRTLGLDYSARDVLLNPVLNWGGKLTNLQAWAGLSSPMSGIKNVFIQMPRGAGLFGTRNTMKSVAYALKVMKDPELLREAMKRGETGYGTRELIEKEAPFIKTWFDKVNLMTKTENLNRIVMAEAGRLHFAELLSVARGEKSMFHPQGKPAEVQRMFKETWRLTDKEIDFVVNGGNIYETRRYQKILQKVGFNSHKAAAGATGVGDLPLFFSNKYIKPFTLFQRMATSVTIDSYTNYVKPLKNGNFAPLIKATIGHGLSGMALFKMYDILMDKQPPNEEDPAIDRAVSYLWKGEFLGMFGELIDPYDEGLSAPIMEPIIIRNAKMAGTEILNVLKYGKGIDVALKDIAFKGFVAAGQAEAIFNTLKHPYVTKSKRIRTLRGSFNDKMGYTTPQGNFISRRQPYYWKLKEAIMFGKSDEEIARAYYKAFNYVASDIENQGNTNISEIKKQAARAIAAVIRNMHPINLPDDKSNRHDSKRNEFLNYLSKENRILALDLEKQYEYRVRKYEKIISQYKWQNYKSIYPY